jgi:predicted regulator of Ras-like GTPase activity (Roadblock/LC7/MglB family)
VANAQSSIIRFIKDKQLSVRPAGRSASPVSIEDIYTDAPINVRQGEDWLASAVGELKRILGEFNARYGASMSAIVSRSGIPIAWNLPQGTPVENFAALSATLLGASEVIYSGVNKPPPNRVIVESDDGVLVVVGLGQKAFVVAMFQRPGDEMIKGIQEVGAAIMDVLKGPG